MSSNNRVFNVGASARASDFQKASDIASAADDRAMEILVTPGAAQKKIVPLSEESLTVNPRLLIVGKDTDATLANGKVRVRPAHFIAGVLSDPNAIGLAGKLDALLDSAVFGNNSSGSTRTDLLYATLSYGAAITASVRQKPTAGGAPVSTTLTVENDITVTLGIVPGVASGSPLASLPADSGSGKTAVYNFGLAAVSIANGFSGGAINQASITPLWTGGWMQPQRVRGTRPGSVYFGAANEKAASHMSERFGSDLRFIAHFKYLSTTGGSPFTGFTIDNSIDWRNRFVWGFISYLGSASQLPIEASVNAIPAVSKDFFCGYTGGGSTGGTVGSLTYNSGASAFGIGQNSLIPGELRGYKLPAGGPIDTTNGDLMMVVIFASDQLTAAM